MTLPSSGSLSLSQIQTEFGGTNPVSVSEYYSGGSYVHSTTSGSRGALPSSGTNKFGNFYGSMRTASATEILNHVWNNRSTYFYKGSNSPNNTWIWSGDVYTLSGSPVNRYVTSYTIAGPVTPAAPDLAPWVTIIAHSTGWGPSIASQFNNIVGTPVTPYYQSNTYDTTWAVYHVQATPTMLNNINVTTNRSSANRGTWSKLLILPGKWGVATTVEMPVSGWSTALQPGRVGWFAGHLMADGNINGSYLQASGTTGYTIYGNEWWYNNAWSFIRFNPTQSNRTFQVAPTADGYGNPDGIWVTNRKYIEFYLL